MLSWLVGMNSAKPKKAITGQVISESEITVKAEEINNAILEDDIVDISCIQVFFYSRCMNTHHRYCENKRGNSSVVLRHL